ncbi:putative lipid II flippase FtsW [candidate division NPL-UPA2 bacterium]|nr:putative lipid II flippase FtsW [candidate division NPL-UPA2 bacterium]
MRKNGEFYGMNKSSCLLFLLTFTLAGIGLVAIYSTSAISAGERFGDSAFFLKRQMLWMGLGLAFMLLAMVTKYELLKVLSKPLLLLSVLLLIMVLLPQFGREAGGARRWLRVGGFSIQPSEMARLAIILYLSAYLARKQDRVKELWRGLLAPLLVLGVVTGLILLQPDLGTSLLIGLVALILLFVAGVRLIYLAGIGFSSLPALYLLITRVPYRQRRILAFLDPWKDPRGVGYQITQSFMALGSGGLSGIGLGESRQKLFYLPAAHTDFIFSIIGEELGFIGTAAILILFLIFIWTGMRIAYRAPDLFGHLLGVGITAAIGLQAIINVGVATGSLPTKGIPLPFISFGGSSLLLNMVGVGLLLNISRNSGNINHREHREK